MDTTQNNTNIEQLQGSIALIEAQYDALQAGYASVVENRAYWRTKAYENQQTLEDAQARVKELEAECLARAGLANWHSQQNASAPAGRMETFISTYADVSTANESAYMDAMTNDGWFPVGISGLADGSIAVMWQRSVASGQVSEGSEAGE
jgi:hypothetical protein